MKELAIGATLLVLVGIAGFLYRSALENQVPVFPGNTCTLETRTCPDGSVSAREGATCAFRSCAAPNVLLGDIAFLPPAGYVQKDEETDVAAHVATFERTRDEGEATHLLRVYTTQNDAPFGEEKTLGQHVFWVEEQSRTDTLVRTAYRLVRDGQTLRFELTERLAGEGEDVEVLPEHAALERALAILSTGW